MACHQEWHLANPFTQKQRTTAGRTMSTASTYPNSLPLIEAARATNSATLSNLVNRALDRLRNVATLLIYDFKPIRGLLLRGNVVAGARRAG